MTAIKLSGLCYRHPGVVVPYLRRNIPEAFSYPRAGIGLLLGWSGIIALENMTGMKMGA